MHCLGGGGTQKKSPAPGVSRKRGFQVSREDQLGTTHFDNSNEVSRISSNWFFSD